MKKASSTSHAGKAFEKTPDEQPSSSSSTGAGLGLPAVLVAFIFLAAGLLTPPLLNKWQSSRVSGNAAGGASNASLGASGRALQGGADTATTSNADASALPLRIPCNDENLADFLHNEPTVGMHTVCFASAPRTRENGEGGVENGIKYTYYAGMHAPSKDAGGVYSKTPSLLNSLKVSLETNLNLPQPGPLQQPYALFTPRGERLWGVSDDLSEEEEIETIANLIKSEMVIIMEGGSWTWPGVRIGFTRTIDLYSIMPGPPGTSWKAEERQRTAEIETLSLKPLVVSVRGFIEPEECDFIEEEAGPHMRYSGVR